MSRTDSTPRRETRKLKLLKVYPVQSRFFDDLPESELLSLAADIRRNGLKNPIEILPANRAGIPANTILAGHQRRRALLKNGEVETEVIVRYDLADADASEIERAILADN